MEETNLIVNLVGGCCIVGLVVFICFLCDYLISRIIGGETSPRHIRSSRRAVSMVRHPLPTYEEVMETDLELPKYNDL